MKKVLFVSSVASMISSFNMENIELLLKKGYEVEVACNFKKGNPISSTKIDQFKEKLGRKNIRFYQIDFDRNPFNFYQHFIAYKQLNSIVELNDYEFIHCHSPIGGAITRIIASKNKTKVIYTAHGFHFHKKGSRLNWLVFYPIEKMLSFNTDVLITINEEDYELARKKFSMKKLYLVPGVGIDHKLWSAKSQSGTTKNMYQNNQSLEEFVFVSVGELNKNKNHQVVLKALAHLKDKNFIYLIVGEGKLDLKLKKLSQKLGISDKVRFLGYRDDVPNILESADCFVFPSLREGLGLAAVEAMAAGLPIITSNVHGINTYSVDGQTGFKCNPTKPEEFIKAMDILMEDQTFRETVSSNNIIQSKKFDTNNVAKIMESIYFDHQ